MQKMGMKVDEVADVTQVIIKTASKDIVIEEPSVTLVTIQGQAMYQIAGGRVSEATPHAVPTVMGEEDAQLVAQQTGRPLDDAKKALLEAGGGPRKSYPDPQGSAQFSSSSLNLLVEQV